VADNGPSLEDTLKFIQDKLDAQVQIQTGVVQQFNDCSTGGGHLRADGHSDARRTSGAQVIVSLNRPDRVGPFDDVERAFFSAAGSAFAALFAHECETREGRRYRAAGVPR
jgi:hypothetical protein